MSPNWRKSSYSGQSGGSSCVEIGSIPWRKSTYSNNGGVDCVEAGQVPGAVLVRDTTQRGAGPVLRLAPADWERFARAVRADAVIR